MTGFDEVEEIMSLGEYRKETSRLQKFLSLLV
jgi:hypothetical protein